MNEPPAKIHFTNRMDGKHYKIYSHSILLQILMNVTVSLANMVVSVAINSIAMNAAVRMEQLERTVRQVIKWSKSY